MISKNGIKLCNVLARRGFKLLLTYREVEGEIAEAVGDDFAFINLDSFQDMGMRTNDQIRTGVNSSVPDLLLVHG